MTIKRASLVFLSLAIYGAVIFFVYLWVKEPAPPHETTPSEEYPNYVFTPGYSPANFEAELEKNRAKWENQQITHYQMSLEPGYSSNNYGHTPYIIEVKDGVVIAVVDAQGNTVSVEDTQSFAYSDRELLTVLGLFSYAFRTFLEEPPTIRVTYNSTYGYPERIFVDPYIEPCCQDFSIDVIDFHVLP
jgi:hypothetical protein